MTNTSQHWHGTRLQARRCLSSLGARSQGGRGCTGVGLRLLPLLTGGCGSRSGSPGDCTGRPGPRRGGRTGLLGQAPRSSPALRPPGSGRQSSVAALPAGWQHRLARAAAGLLRRVAPAERREAVPGSAGKPGPVPGCGSHGAAAFAASWHARNARSPLPKGARSCKKGAGGSARSCGSWALAGSSLSGSASDGGKLLAGLCSGRREPRPRVSLENAQIAAGFSSVTLETAEGAVRGDAVRGRAGPGAASPLRSQCPGAPPARGCHGAAGRAGCCAGPCRQRAGSPGPAAPGGEAAASLPLCPSARTPAWARGERPPVPGKRRIAAPGPRCCLRGGAERRRPRDSGHQVPLLPPHCISVSSRGAGC